MQTLMFPILQPALDGTKDIRFLPNVKANLVLISLLLPVTPGRKMSGSRNEVDSDCFADAANP
jgi:hypothetical protein